MASDSTPTGPIRRRTPGRLARMLLVVIVALVVVVAGFAVYSYEAARPPSGKTLLTIYTYSSLFGGTCGPPPNVTAAVFAPFEAAHNVTIQLECPSGTLVSTLVAQKNSPGADLVVGLDEITAAQADASGVLVPYVSTQLSNITPGLVSEISPDHAVTPYEWGYLGIDYNASFFTSTHGAVAQSSFQNFSSNSSWARQLMIEDPETDITGEEFLIWEIEYYEQVLHTNNWMAFWQAVDPSIRVAQDWSTAFSAFTTPPNNPQLVVSYTTDPAYAAFYGGPGAYNSTVSYTNGTYDGWKTVYGLGIVRGSSHLALDQDFINWFLSGTVQSEIPTNEWEYPANRTIPVPGVFRYAPNPAEFVTLNNGVNATALYSALANEWLPEWQTIYNNAACPSGDGCGG
ncbi:MAG: thiamine ABC transporter substrate-binding protein [Thermoplasmata archaeon]